MDGIGHRTGRTRLAALIALAVIIAFAAVAAVGARPAQAANWYHAVSFVNAKDGWLTGNGSGSRIILWRTTNGGKTWSKMSSRPAAGGGDLGDVALASRRTGIWSWGGVLRSINGGVTWSRVNTRGAYFSGIDFATAKSGWAVSWYGTDWSGGGVSRTTDAGATWKEKLSKRGDSGYGAFRAVSSPASAICYALGDGKLGGVWATQDGGANWAFSALPTIFGVPSGQTQYDDVSFPSGLVGWAVGANGAIVRTADGGGTWSAQASGVSARLLAVSFADAQVGFAVGEGGTIVRTTDGGATWQPLASGTTKDIEDVCAVDATHAWAVGANGVRLRTVDGGATWVGVR